MATLHSITGLPASRRSPPGWRAGRVWPALALVAAVLGGHAWLVARLAPAAPRAGMPRPALVQLRSLQVAMVPAAAAATTPVAQPWAKPSTVAAMPAMPVSRKPARRPVVAATAQGPNQSPVSAQPPDAEPTVVTDLGPAADASEADAGTPPPLYATRPPPPALLRYALRYNGRSGEAQLDWRHDGARYQLTLDGSDGDGRLLIAQASTGALNQHGLAPERFVDRRRAGRQQAANFRRDIGRISYSGPAHQHPAWAGAQDRLSWLVQLLAILAAADAPPVDLQLFVADAFGHAGFWQLQRQADATGPTPWGEQLLQHWQREPPRLEGLRIDVWLVAQPDAPAQAWPLRVRFVVPRSGDAFELALLAMP